MAFTKNKIVENIFKSINSEISFNMSSNKSNWVFDKTLNISLKSRKQNFAKKLSKNQ